MLRSFVGSALRRVTQLSGRAILHGVGTMPANAGRMLSVHGLTLAVGMLVLSLSTPAHAQAEDGTKMRFYCGTYTTKMGHVDGKAEAIYLYDIDSKTGQLTQTGQSPPVTNSSHMALSTDGEHLYVSSEVVQYQGREDGYLTTYAVDAGSGGLTELAKISSHGPGPAYLRLDQTGRFLLLANYVGGNVVAFPIDSDGQLEESKSQAAHAGKSVNPARQEAPHPHAIVASPDNRFVYVPDLGIDRIVAYRFDGETGVLTPVPDLDVITPPGSGPRHFVFGPPPKDGSQRQLAYCSLELSSELAIYSYEDGKLSEVARLSTLPPGFSGKSTTAEVRVSGDGQFVYVANRGHDSIAVFAVRTPAECEDEQPIAELVQTVSSAGKTPRNFGISPDGQWVVVGNQDSHTLVALKRDPQTGLLNQVGQPVECASPALIYFVPARLD